MYKSQTILMLVYVLSGVIIGTIISLVFLSNDSGSKSAELIVKSPIVSNITVEGKVIDVTNDKLVIEKNGERLEANIEKNSTFARIPKDIKSAQQEAEFSPLNKIPKGSEVQGGAQVRYDESTKEYKVYAVNFWVK